MKKTKPRSVVCWSCGKLLYQRRVFVEKLVDGHPRILHKDCAKKIDNQDLEENEYYDSEIEDCHEIQNE